jgi:putative flippase GtrA
VRFAAVGIAGTAAYLAGYVLLSTTLPVHLANVTARIAVAVPSTWLNGRHTFGSRVSAPRLIAGTLATLAAGIAITDLPLAVEQTLVGSDDRAAELLTLTGATAAAAAVRFLLLRNWLFRSAAGSPVQRDATPTETRTSQPAGS